MMGKADPTLEGSTARVLNELEGYSTGGGGEYAKQAGRWEIPTY